jgi:uncharacterized protein YbjT (DUF2867 family)
MFTVFGATGNTGAVVADRLLAAGKSVRVAVRDAGKVAALAARGAEVVAGELTDRAFVTRALTGAEAAYLIAPPDLKARDLIARNRQITDHYAAGLTTARVGHAVFLSSVGAQHESGLGPATGNHWGEVALQGLAGTRVTFVRAPFFMENLLGNAHVMASDGILPVFGGGESSPFPMIATRDIADIAADALVAPGSATRWIELRGPRDYSYVDAAQIASDVLGRKVTATPLPLAAMAPALIRAGFSPEVAALFREMTEGGARGLFAYENKGSQATGKTTLPEVLARLKTAR